VSVLLLVLLVLSVELPAGRRPGGPDALVNLLSANSVDLVAILISPFFSLVFLFGIERILSSRLRSAGMFV
jgi:hypothetical protein